MEGLIRNFRYARRALWSSPLTSLVIVLTLALGIGANSAIFSVVDGILLKPLPFPDSHRIVTLWEDFSSRGGPQQEWIEVPNFLEWKQGSDSFETMSAWGFQPANLLIEGEAERLVMGMVSWDYMATFGVEPVAGRDFRRSDDQPGAEPVVLLSSAFWKRRLGSRSEAVGERLSINGEMMTVVGILPEGFRTPLGPAPDLWATLRLDPAQARRGNFFLRCVARLKAGVGVDAAKQELDAMMARIGSQFPENEGVRIQVVPLLDQLVAPARQALWVLLGVVAVVLLIACANVAGLMLSRSAARSREMAVRSAMGARRGELVAQLLAESTLLGLLGGVGGLLLAWLGVQALTALAPPLIPRLEAVQLDWRVVLFTAAVSLLTGLVFGIVPARTASRTDVSQVLQEGNRSGGTSAGSWMRSVLVTGEMAMAVLLLVVAVLLVRSFDRLMSVDVGFRPHRVMALQLSLTPDRFPDPPAINAFWDQLLQRLQARGEVEEAAAISVLPLSGADTDTGFDIPGRPQEGSGEDQPTAWYRQVTPGYFRTLGLQLLAGREFEAADRDSNASVVIVSDALVERYFPALEPRQAVGERLLLGRREVEIVGVVKGVRHNSLQSAPRPEMYLPQSLFPARNMNLVVRSSAPSETVARLLRSEVAGIDGNVPVTSLQRLEDLLQQSVAPDRFFMRLTASFAVLAVLLAAVGVYGVVSYQVAARTWEMGLRMALGAPRSRVLGMILAQGARLLLLGLVIGIPASLLLTRLLSERLFEISPLDPVSYLLAAALLTGVAMLACLRPALRATRIDPQEVLRAP
ncbi:MAG TPA: ABC transporter permease [Acidobacteriota bacterium]|nr:ABC transporter permease [Acidobacteriota bacterium]